MIKQKTSEMTSPKKRFVTENSWQFYFENLQRARIRFLWRSWRSDSYLLEMLAFQLAHAQARDAVHTPLRFEKLYKDSLGEL